MTPGIVAHVHNPSSEEAEAGGCGDFEASLGYMCLRETKAKEAKAVSVSLSSVSESRIVEG